MAEEVQEAPKKGSKMKLIVIVLLLLVIGAGGYIAYDKFLSGGEEETTEEPTSEGTEESGEAQVPSESRSPEGAMIVTLDTFTVNLADPLGRRYLKITVDVEVINEDVAATLEAEDPKVKDRIITLLTSMSFADISTPEGKLLLKNEIVDRLNQILGGPMVLNVYFTEFIVQ
ncbi:MAG: flagellar basal body protein FliL [Desulfovibrio sp.]|nr:MAG: flagellar basal body protein FliL [Desulfovibrio sp.]